VQSPYGRVIELKISQLRSTSTFDTEPGTGPDGAAAEATGWAADGAADGAADEVTVVRL
jgi:hypothetical protein